MLQCCLPDVFPFIFSPHSGEPNTHNKFSDVAIWFAHLLGNLPSRRRACAATCRFAPRPVLLLVLVFSRSPSAVADFHSLTLSPFFPLLRVVVVIDNTEECRAAPSITGREGPSVHDRCSSFCMSAILFVDQFIHLHAGMRSGGLVWTHLRQVGTPPYARVLQRLFTYRAVCLLSMSSPCAMPFMFSAFGACTATFLGIM